MRFFAHDGKTTHGPAEVEELLKLPGFDGDTLVCPVGSADSADWKPALAYPLFKRALLAPEPAPPPAAIPLPVPAAPPPPPAAAATTPCPRCSHPNPEPARFCNACGAIMAAQTQPPAPGPESFAGNDGGRDPFAAPHPMSPLPIDRPAPAPMPEPEPLPAPRPEPARKPSQPRRMGQLAAFEDSAPAAPIAPSPVAEPQSSPTAAPMWKSPAMISILMSMAIVASGLAWKKFAARSASQAASEPRPPAPEPKREPAPPPPPVPAPPAPVAKPRPPAAAKPPAKARRRRTRKPTRAVKKTEAPAPVASEGTDAQLESLLSDAKPSPAVPVEKPAPAIETKPAAPKPPQETAEPKHFTLPGLDRPISAGPRKNEPKMKAAHAAEPTAAQAMSLPGFDTSTTPSSGQAQEDDQPALAQVKEQFEFCVQLLAQGAYADHYDTCLCKDARKAAPYRGRRSSYVAALKKAAADGRLDNAAKILASTLNDGTATVTAHWRVLPNEFGRDLTQTWRLEDGLWCRAPY